MARDTTLVKLLDMLRISARLSLNPAHNSDDRAYQVGLLQMEQSRLWDDFDWPHLRVERQVPIQTGQRYYDTPADMRIDRIERIDVFRDGAWCKLHPGIDSGSYELWNSDLGERSSPAYRWKPYEDEQIEIWPISDRNSDPATQENTLRFTGIRDLRPLVADTDRADLDDQMLISYVAAKMLAGKGAKDTQLVLAAANDRYARLRGRMTPRTGFQMFGIGKIETPRRLQITNYRPASEN